MASFVYNTAAKEMWDGTVDLLNDTIKVMLVDSTYSPDRDDDVVDAGGGSDAADAEISVSGYTGGYGGAGRKTLGTKAITTDKTNDRAEFDAANSSWTALGSGATIVGAIVIKEGPSADTASRLIAYLDFTDTATNGGDFTLQYDAEGIIQLATA